MAIAGIVKGNRALILAKVEATYGTDPTPAVGANEIFPDSFEFQPKINMIAKSRVGPTHRSPGFFAGAKWYEYTAKFSAHGGPDPDVGNLEEPDWSTFLQSAGFALATTGTPDDTHTYTLSSTQAIVSQTIYEYQYEDGDANAWLCEANGCVNNAKFTMSEDAGAHWEFAGMGLYVKPVDAAAPSLAGIDYVDSTDAMTAISGTLTIGGATFVISSLEFDVAMEVVARPSIGVGTEGRAGFVPTRGLGSSITGKLTAELKDQSVDDRFDDIATNTTAALSIVLTSAGGTIVTIAAPALQFTDTTIDREQALVMIDQSFSLNDSTDGGDDALSVVVTHS